MKGALEAFWAGCPEGDAEVPAELLQQCSDVFDLWFAFDRPLASGGLVVDRLLATDRRLGPCGRETCTCRSSNRWPPVPSSYYTARMSKKPRTTSFSLGDELSAFIRSQVESGAYGSASEVVRDALLRLADEQRKEASVLTALDEGLASGRARAGVFARARRRRVSRS